jgi:hypothetical protein
VGVLLDLRAAGTHGCGVCVPANVSRLPYDG